MTALRQRFIEDLQLQGKSDRTQQAYVRAVRMLAEHVHTPPDQLTDEQIRQDVLYVKNTRHWSFSTMKQALCAIKTFYTQTLHRDWGILDVIRPPKTQTLPDVLTHDEVQRLLQAVRLPHAAQLLSMAMGADGAATAPGRAPAALSTVLDDYLLLRLTADRRRPAPGDGH